MNNSYSIGEFSLITGLSVKTLRFYHEQGILLPSSVDSGTGYRFYDESKIEKARIIMRLRAMEFSIEDIEAVIGKSEDEADILNYLQRQRNTLQQRIREDRDIVRSLDEIIATENAARQLLEHGNFSVEEKSTEEMLIAGLRMKGEYRAVGEGFGRLSKAVGRYICGKPLTLYYDCEYRDNDADFEPCLPIRKRVEAPGISVRSLPTARCVTLIHRGPYDQLGRSYAKIMKHVRAAEMKITLPTREVYLKGPGMIFKGNPKNYLTEIQLPLGG
jgi:DNA-binding transcriptional MerR regulator/effector-binding domain-containing protein